MKMTKKERKIFENNGFGIHEGKEIYELEEWTNGGVDMIITIFKDSDNTVTDQFREYIENFDVDEEIDVYRQDKRYCDAFRITESVKDFEDWEQFVTDILKELESEEK